MGLLCAWSDRYYVRNLGHEYNEFGRDPEYYKRNYESKPWLRMEGFSRRLEAARDWERTAQRIADGLGVTWPNKTEGVGEYMAGILRPRHRHHRVTNGAAYSSLSSLTTRAWQAVEHALAADEAAARIVFDEIHTAITEVDRLNAPHNERIEKLLSDARTVASEANLRCERLQRELCELRGQIDSIRASICWRVTIPIRWFHKQVNRARNALAKINLRRCRPT